MVIGFPKRQDKIGKRKIYIIIPSYCVKHKIVFANIVLINFQSR